MADGGSRNHRPPGGAMSLAAAPSDQAGGPEGDLQRVLRKLAASPNPAPDCAGRPVAQVPPLGTLSGVLEEIDETVMARCLVLQNGTGATLELEVCNRRLLAVLGAETGRHGHGHGGTGTNLTYAGRADLSALRESLLSFCAAEPVTVRSMAPAGSATLEQTGVGVSTLRQAWHANPGQPSRSLSDRQDLPVPAYTNEATAAAASPSAFLTKVGELRALGLFTDEAVSVSDGLATPGTHALASDLEPLLTDASRWGMLPDDDGPVGLFLAPEAGAGSGIVFGRIGRDRIVAQLDPRDWPMFLEIWLG